MIKHLISVGVDIHAVDVYGNTPLHYAAQLRDAGIIKALLISKADINHVNKLKDGISIKCFARTITYEDNVLMDLIRNYSGV